MKAGEMLPAHVPQGALRCLGSSALWEVGASLLLQWATDPAKALGKASPGEGPSDAEDWMSLA